MNTFLQWGTVVSIKGARKGGEVELAYASFLSSGSVGTRVLKEGVLKKKAASANLYEKWNDRHVTIRGNFLCVGRVNFEAQSKVFMMTQVANGIHETDFTVVCSDNGRLHFRADANFARDEWVKTMSDALQNAGSLPHMQDGKPSDPRPNSQSLSLHGLRRSEIGQSADSLDSSPSPARSRFHSTEATMMIRSSTPVEEQANVPEGPQQTLDLGAPIVAAKPPVSKTKSLSAPPVQAPAPCTVGVFWDTTTVMAPRTGIDAATQKVREFAAGFGSVEVLKVYREEDVKAGGGKSLRKKLDKDLLLWLWDHSRQATAGDSMLILISDRAFLETLKEIAHRGTRVVVVNSHMDRSVASSGSTTVEYQLASRVLWDAGSAAAGATQIAASSKPQQDACSDDSDLGSDQSSGADGTSGSSFSRAASSVDKGRVSSERRSTESVGGGGGEERRREGVQSSARQRRASQTSGEGRRRVSVDRAAVHAETDGGGAGAGGAGAGGAGRETGAGGGGVEGKRKEGEGGIVGAARELGASTWMLIAANVLLAVLLLWSK